MYGMSSFAKITVESKEERGCRMKSVGVFATSYSTLHRYKKFLEEQVKYVYENNMLHEESLDLYEKDFNQACQGKLICAKAKTSYFK